MRTKMRLSLTIDENTYKAVEEAAKTNRLPKSQIAQQAFELWLKKETETMMFKGYEEMWEEDREFTDLVFESQREALS